MEHEQLSMVFRALSFAAEKHAHQRRKGVSEIPYLNHCIKVAATLVDVAGIDDPEIIAAALLHDTVEDTDTTPEELEREFGSTVCALVLELTDNKALPKLRRKQLQVENASHKSGAAVQIKLSDKVCNVMDVALDPPPNWPHERRVEYLDWAERVVSALPDPNPALLRFFHQTVADARERLGR